MNIDNNGFGKKSLQFCDIKADGESGVIEAIVSVFGNVDSYGERVVYGAFAKSITSKLPVGVWMHDWSSPVAKTLEAKELAPGDPTLPESLRELGGLYVKAKFNLDTQVGRETFSNIKAGIVDEFSIGYRLIEWKYNEETEVWDLLELDLIEWSPVIRGANSATALVSAKQDDFKGRSFLEHSKAVQAAAEDFVNRVNSIKEKREGRSKWLSGDSMESARQVLASLKTVSDALAAVLETEHGGDDNSNEKKAWERESERIRMNVHRFAATVSTA